MLSPRKPLCNTSKAQTRHISFEIHIGVPSWLFISQLQPYGKILFVRSKTQAFYMNMVLYAMYNFWSFYILVLWLYSNYCSSYRTWRDIGLSMCNIFVSTLSQVNIISLYVNMKSSICDQQCQYMMFNVGIDNLCRHIRSILV